MFLKLIGIYQIQKKRKLKVNRIKLHKHLFASLLFNSIMQFIWELNYNLNGGPNDKFLVYFSLYNSILKIISN